MAEEKKGNFFINLLKSIGRFLISKIFLKNLLFILGITAFIFFLLFMFLFPGYTRHGEERETPDITNLTVSEVQQLMKTRDLRLIVTDSIYDPKKTSGVILDQMPKAGEKVKPNRSIYVTINTANPPLVSLHYKQLIGRPYSYVERKLTGMGLKIGKTEFIPCKGASTIVKVFVDDRVLFVEANPAKGEKPPTEAQRIPKGTVVDLHICRGEDSELKAVPGLQCLSYQQALFKIKSSEYHIGNLHLHKSVGIDTFGATIWMQSPRAGNKAGMGTGIELWLTKERIEACEEEDTE